MPRSGFHGHGASSEVRITDPTTPFPGSHHDGTPPGDGVRTGRHMPAPTSPMRSLRASTRGSRNINRVSIREFRLRTHLGSTNPRRMIVVEEPWPLRRTGFSPVFAVTPPRIFIRMRSTGAHAPTSTRTPRLHTQSRPSGVCSHIGDRLSPVHFRCPYSRLVSCYALFEGWLLLSPPPSCLGVRTPFGLTLSRYLGPLMRGWVAFPFARRAYPCRAHSRLLRRPALRSSTTGRALSGPYPIIGALHTGLPPPRPTCE